MKNTKKLGVMLLVGVVAVGTYFVSGTYAKYTSAISGSADADVAKWQWTINETVIDSYEKSVAENAYTFNLFETINDTNGTDAETDVAANLIAPGTSGKATLNLTNNSEVNAEYTITFVEEQTNLPTGVTRIPVEYSLDGQTWKTDITELNTEAVAIEMNESAEETEIQWRWVYSVDEDGDAIDTKIGFGANENVPNVKVTATVTVTQVD